MKEIKSEKIFEPDKKLSGFEKVEIVETGGKFSILKLLAMEDDGFSDDGIILNETDIKELHSLFDEIIAKYWPEKEEKKTTTRKPRTHVRKKQ